MQSLYNVAYVLVDSAMSLLDNVPCPVYLRELSTGLSRYCLILNYYFPLDTLCNVATGAVTFVAVLILVNVIKSIKF